MQFELVFGYGGGKVSPSVSICPLHRDHLCLHPFCYGEKREELLGEDWKRNTEIPNGMLFCWYHRLGLGIGLILVDPIWTL